MRTICMEYQGLFSGKNKKNIINLSSAEFVHRVVKVNPCPAEPGYTLSLQTVCTQISWLQKPTDLDLHCLT